MRLINADKVKAESREHCKTCILNGTKHCDKTCVINLICDRLDLQPTIQEVPHDEWIAVKDKFPDKDGEYLVSLENGRIVVADGRSIIENHDFEPKMLAWQPLPEAYKEGGTE